jgi:peptidoglycan/xylan/chitin deacetylase (PgdA/CDA1 family)
MNTLKSRLTRSGLDALYYSKIYHLFSPMWSGVGVIFTLHHVREVSERDPFRPNAILEITPDFLDATIQQIINTGYEIVSLDEAQRRLIEQDFKRKFVCFTLDDGYLDNYLNAYPVFKKYGAPFTVYINTGMPDGNAILWWWLLEQVVLENDEVVVTLDAKEHRFPAISTSQKYQTFNTIYWALRQMPHAQQYATILQLFDTYGIDWRGFCRASAMSWDMIQELSESGLATIGAHTVNHYALSKLSAEEVYEEANTSRDIISERFGDAPRHFSYPYGDASSAASREFDIIKDLGFATATTTRKGVLFPEHVQHLHALPRVSLNGSYQMNRYITLFLSGAPFALWQRFNRLDVN